MDIEKEVRHLLDGLDFEDLQRQTLKQRIRAFLVECVDPAWARCKILRQRLPGGSEMFTASRQGAACRTIHTLVLVLSPAGEWQLAAPSPVNNNEY